MKAHTPQHNKQGRKDLNVFFKSILFLLIYHSIIFFIIISLCKEYKNAYFQIYDDLKEKGEGVSVYMSDGNG